MISEIMTQAPDTFEGFFWAYYWFWFAKGLAQTVLGISLFAVVFVASWLALRFVRETPDAE